MTRIAIEARTAGIVAGREIALGMITIEGIMIGETEIETSIEVETMTETTITTDPRYRTPALHHHHLQTPRRILLASFLLPLLLPALLPRTWLR